MPHPITQPCGTYAAARRHERRHEPLCQPCAEARREWWRERSQIAYSIPAFRARENARTAARLARRRAEDPTWRDRANKARRDRKLAEKKASREIVDPVVVERLIDGQPPLHVTKHERAEAVRILDARGWTHSLIAQQLAMSGTRVAQILDGFVRPVKHTPHADNNRQEASA